ncbi:unnamed protein product [Natator depressus]
MAQGRGPAVEPWGCPAPLPQELDSQGEPWLVSRSLLPGPSWLGSVPGMQRGYEYFMVVPTMTPPQAAPRPIKPRPFGWGGCLPPRAPTGVSQGSAPPATAALHGGGPLPGPQGLHCAAGEGATTRSPAVFRV